MNDKEKNTNDTFTLVISNIPMSIAYDLITTEIQAKGNDLSPEEIYRRVQEEIQQLGDDNLEIIWDGSEEDNLEFLGFMKEKILSNSCKVFNRTDELMEPHNFVEKEENGVHFLECVDCGYREYDIEQGKTL